MRFQGAWTALVTPMSPDGSVDWGGLSANVEFQLSQGVSGLLPVGTTGESPTLNWEEHNELVETVISRCSGRRPVLAGTGSNSTSEAISSTRHAVEAGAEAVLLVDCYYNGPSSQELRDQYHGAVAREFPDTVVVPYVIPGRTGTELTVEDIAVLADQCPNVTTVKEATGNVERMARTRALLGVEFSIMSGDDDITCKIMSDPAVRADGVISVASNIVPAGMARLAELAASGDLEGARGMHEALSPLLGIITVKVDNPRRLPSGETVVVTDRYRNPLAVKTLMTGLGMPAGPCRRPLGRMTSAGVDVVRAAANRVWQANPELLKPIGEFYDVDIAARLADDQIWNSLALPS